MKTLIVTLEYPPTIGGIASYTYNFTKHLDPADTIIFAPLAKESKNFDTSNAWKTYRRNPFFWIIWPYWLKALWQIWRIAKKEKIEVIHVHHVLPMGYVAEIIKKWLKIPYILFLHGSDLRFARKNRFKLSNFRRVCKKAESIVVNSDFCRRQLESITEKLPPIKIIHPCPSDEFINASYSQTEIDKLKSELALNGKKVIISVSRLVERKGHALFVPAFVKILKNIPNAVWLIIGDGPEKNNIANFIKKNNLQSVIRFLPSLPPLEVIKYYHCADLFLLLTHQDKDGVEEAWGIVFLEAAACGLPVIAGRSGGVEEAVQNLVTGIVVDAHNADLVATTTVELLKNSEYARQMGQAGKERVGDEFTWANQMKSL